MNGITVLVDADACPVVKSVERIAKNLNVPVVLLCDTNHVLKSDYSEIKIIGAGADAVDLALVNLCKRGDIAVTQITELRHLCLERVRIVFINREKFSRMIT